MITQFDYMFWSREPTSSMLDETESKTVHEDKEGDWLRKKK